MARFGLSCSILLCGHQGCVRIASLGIEVQPRPVRRAPRGKLNQIQQYPNGGCTLPAQVVFRLLRLRKPVGIGAKQAVFVWHESANALEALGLVPGQAINDGRGVAHSVHRRVAQVDQQGLQRD
jgi:hypothetical protein